VTRWLRVALAAQLLFFAGWGAVLLTSHRDVEVVWLATDPVDPRDLLSGHYVALRYAMSSAERAGCPASDRAPSRATLPVWVRLVPSGETVPTVEMVAAISKPAECRTTPPASEPGEVWIAGTRDGARITYGIERMFVGEDDPLRSAASGSVVAKVAINDRFEPRLIGLLPKETPVAPVEGTP
jgi:uncharacterized membrane-anchored protein